jgi:glycosyltransferase involved in cell wall biosynthesis
MHIFMNSEVTIVTAAFNAGSTLSDCFRSVSGQSIGVRHVLIDGGSTDSTQQIIEEKIEQLTAVIREPDQGIYDALNKGISEIGEGIVGILHADDLFADEHVIDTVLEAFQDPRLDAIYGDLDYVDRTNSGKILRRWRAGEFRSRNFYYGWMPPHPTFFVRRECYEKFGLYRLDLGTAADYELMLRFLLVQKIRVKYIPRVLVKMRTGGASNASLGARWRANRMDRKAWEVNGLKPYPWTLIAKPLRKLGQWWPQ